MKELGFEVATMLFLLRFHRPFGLHVLCDASALHMPSHPNPLVLFFAVACFLHLPCSAPAHRMNAVQRQIQLLLCSEWWRK